MERFKTRKEIQYQRTLKAVPGDKDSSSGRFMNSISQGLGSSRRFLMYAVILLAFTGPTKCMTVNEANNMEVSEDLQPFLPEMIDFTPIEKMPPFMRAVKYKLEETMGSVGEELAEHMGRQLTHSGNTGNLYWGYCVDYTSWVISGGCSVWLNLGDESTPDGLYNKWHKSLSTTCTLNYQCMDCSISLAPGSCTSVLRPFGCQYGWHCKDNHACLSCFTGAHLGNRCPAADSQGCRVPVHVDIGETGYGDCYNALGKLAWSPSVLQVQNVHDVGVNLTPKISYSNWGQYMTNSRPDCFTHCYLTRCDNRYVGNGGTCDYLELGLKNGSFTYDLHDPFYYDVDFTCDNGFMEHSWEFYLEVACHPTSTNVTITGVIEHQSHAIRQDSTWYPYHTHTDFQTTTANCDLLTGQVSSDAQGAPLDPKLDPTIRDLGVSDNRVQVNSGFQQKKGFYEFYVSREARGGAESWTPRLTLTVYCDLNSATVSSTTHEIDQTYDVGSSHGFYFQEWTQNTDCPIEKYRITITTTRNTDHADFIQAENTYITRRDQQGSSLDLMMAEVWNTDIETTYYFKIEATAEGGAYRWSTSQRSLTYKCLDNVYMQQPFDFNTDLYSSLKAIGYTTKFDWSDFTSFHHLCPIIKYDIDNDSVNTIISSPSQVTWDTTCKTQYGDLCKTINLKVDTIGTYDFWVVVFVKGGSKKNFKVTVTVGCGDELVTVSPTEIVRVYPLDTFTNTSPININATLTDAAWKSHFTITHPQISVCGFKSYKVWKYENGTGTVDSNITLTNPTNENNANIRLLDHQGMNNKIFYIQVVTDGGASNILKFDYTICGEENIQPKSNLVYDYMWRRTDTDQQRTLTYQFLDNLFTSFELSGGNQACQNETIDLFTDPWCKLRWNNPIYPFEKVAILPDGGGKQMVYQYTNVSYPETTLYACRRTFGNIYAKVRMNFEVCGSETVSLAPNAGYNGLSYLNLTYPQYECKQYYCLTDRASYRNNFTSSSRMCEVNHFKVFTKDANGNFVPENSNMVSIDTNGNLVVKTHQSYNKQLYIGAYDVAGTDYLTVNVTVTPLGAAADGSDAVNQPPYMTLGIENLQANMSNNNFTTAPLYLQLSEFQDDFYEWESLIIQSEELGNITFSNATGVMKSDYFQVLNYDEDTNRIYFEFSSYLEYAKYKGLHTLNVTITDSRGAASSYRPNATFSYEPYREPIPTALVKSQHPHMGFYAYVQSIDQFGQVEIKFSKTLDSEIDIQKLNSSGMDIYVEPYREWTDDYRNGFNHSLDRMNFTWYVKAIENDTMFLNVSFYKPHWISTQIPLQKDETGHDDLVIHFKNWAENLNDDTMKRYNRRVLVNDGEASEAGIYKGVHIRSIDEEYFVSRNSTAKFPIRHQFYQGAPEDSLNVYSDGKKDFLKSLIIVGGLMQLAGLSSSFYLITAMMTSLQLAIHLPIMNFKFPSNVMTYLKSMVPVVMFDVIENHPFYVTIFDSKADGLNVTDIRPQVEDLTYDKHNPWLNLGTLAFVLFLNCIRVLFLLFVLYPCTTCNHKKTDKVKRAYRNEKNDLFWGDFFFIFIEGFLEILIASVVFFYVPLESYENTGSLSFTTTVFLVITCGLIPLVFLYVLTRNVKKYRARHFTLRYGALYKRIRFQNKPQMFYYGIFVFRRILYVLLISEAMFSNPVQQVIALVLMNFAVMIYFTQVLPKSSFFLNWLEIFNECQVTLCTYHLYVFTAWVPDYDTQYFMGWVFIIILSLAFLVNVLFILFTLYKEIKLLCIKYWNILKEKCKDICKKKPKKETPKPPQIEPPTPPPPEVKKEINLGTYQPQMYAMKGGKVFKMKDENNVDIEKIIITNDDNIKDESWKHQNAPVEMDKFNWSNMPSMVNINPSNNESKNMKNLANPNDTSKFGGIPDPAPKKRLRKIAPQDKSSAFKRGTTLDRIMESAKEQDASISESSLSDIQDEHTQEMKDLNKFFQSQTNAKFLKPESSDNKIESAKKYLQGINEMNLSFDEVSIETMEEIKNDPAHMTNRATPTDLNKTSTKPPQEEAKSPQKEDGNDEGLTKSGKKKKGMLILDKFAQAKEYENPFRNERNEREWKPTTTETAEFNWKKAGGL